MKLIIPQWPAPETVGACSTTRSGGVSQAPWDSLNLGAHVGDAISAVQANRQRLLEQASLPAMPLWLEQVHGNQVLVMDGQQPDSLQADAVYTRQRGVVCAIMTADCLPVLFCSRDGKEVAAAHAGWRGLCGGVLEATLAHFTAPAEDILAWFGPAIGPRAFEVGAEVRAVFMAQGAQAASAFRPAGEKYYADIWQLATQRLQWLGVRDISGGDRCTLTEAGQFFSYRREGVTGRMASLIWRK